MAAYDLDEQEKLGDLKAWWAKWGNIFSGIVLIIVLAVAGSQAYKWWNAKQAAEASSLYFGVNETVKDLQTAATTATDKSAKQDTAKLKTATTELLEKFPKTGYAPRAALLAAKAAVDAGDTALAQSNLEWVIANSKEDELKSIARMRLASVLLDQQKYDAALAALEGKNDPAFEGLMLDLKGDIFNIQGKKADAKTAYEAALSKLDAKGQLKQYTQLKLDAVSGDATTAVAAPAAPVAPAKTEAKPAAAVSAQSAAAPSAVKTAEPAKAK